MLLMAGCATVVITVSSKACSIRMHPFIAMEVMLCMTSDLSKLSGSKDQARTSSQQLSCCSQHKRSAHCRSLTTMRSSVLALTGT